MSRSSSRRGSPVTARRAFTVVGNTLVPAKGEPQPGGTLDLNELAGKWNASPAGGCMVKRKLPPTRMSIWISGVVNPWGPHHLASSSVRSTCRRPAQPGHRTPAPAPRRISRGGPSQSQGATIDQPTSSRGPNWHRRSSAQGLRDGAGSRRNGGTSGRTQLGFGHRHRRVSPRADFALSGSDTGVLRVCCSGPERPPRLSFGVTGRES